MKALGMHLGLHEQRIPRALDRGEYIYPYIYPGPVVEMTRHSHDGIQGVVIHFAQYVPK